MFLLEPIQLGIRLVQLERQRRPVELEFALCPSAYWHLSIEDKLPPLLVSGSTDSRSTRRAFLPHRFGRGARST